jgi:hypothetical protein
MLVYYDGIQQSVKIDCSPHVPRIRPQRVTKMGRRVSHPLQPGPMSAKQSADAPHHSHAERALQLDCASPPPFKVYGPSARPKLQGLLFTQSSAGSLPDEVRTHNFVPLGCPRRPCGLRDRAAQRTIPLVWLRSLDACGAGFEYRA